MASDETPAVAALVRLRETSSRMDRDVLVVQIAEADRQAILRYVEAHAQALADLRQEYDAVMERDRKVALAHAQVRLFPIQRGPAAPWMLMAPHEAQAMRNHGRQTLERLAERGGLSPCEAVAVLEDREWHPMEQGEAKRRLQEIIDTDARVALTDAQQEIGAHRHLAYRNLARAEQAEALVTRLTQALKEHEWGLGYGRSSIVASQPRCPACQQKETDGHREDRWFAAALAEAHAARLPTVVQREGE